MPRCWVVRSQTELLEAAEQICYPCVVKPVFSNNWRTKNRWEVVGGRKAIGVASRDELLSEYAQVSAADPCALIQEMVPGGDDQLFIAACYLDQDGRAIASFTAQKLLQVPAGFGTGCIVQTTDRPEVVELALGLLRSMRFSGIAEVEFKYDTSSRQYRLIEVNPRPWDQHSLGRAAGVDLIHIAYCERTGLPLPQIRPADAGYRWIAEDVYLTTALRLLWNRDPQIRQLYNLAKGKRTYGIWSSSDKWPFIRYMATFVPQLIGVALRGIGAAFQRLFRKASLPYHRRLRDANTKG